MMDLFLTNMQLFTSQDIKWWTGVVWIIVMFLSAVWTLILTAPIHCRGSNGEQVMQCYISPNMMKKKQNSSTSCMAWVWVFYVNFHFWWSIPLRKVQFNHSKFRLCGGVMCIQLLNTIFLTWLQSIIIDLDCLEHFGEPKWTYRAYRNI